MTTEIEEIEQKKIEEKGGRPKLKQIHQEELEETPMEKLIRLENGMRL